MSKDTLTRLRAQALDKFRAERLAQGIKGHRLDQECELFTKGMTALSERLFWSGHLIISD